MGVLNKQHPLDQSLCSSFSFPSHTISSRQIELTGNDKKQEEQVDSLLASALSSLSFVERQKQQEILHGVATEIPETEAMLKEAFETFEYHLQKVKRGSAYETAESLDFHYVSDRAFRLMFLRGNQFDAKAAAGQMIRFFDMKLNIFGREKLVKDITMNDLSEDDKASLRTGAFQLIGTDQAGRIVWLNLPGLRAFRCPQNELRGRYYLYMDLLKSEQARKRGVVVVSYAIDRFGDSANGAGYVELVRQSLAMPFHHAALHNCVNDSKEYILVSAALAVVPARDRSRIRMHLGSHMEIQYILSTYGITTQLLPLAPMTNDVVLDRHLRWYHDCLARDTGNQQLGMMDAIMPKFAEPCCNNLLLNNNEQRPDSMETQRKEMFESVTTSNTGPAIIAHPGSDDVVLGRNNKGLGNQSMMRLVKDRFGDYDTAGRGEKSSIANSIVQKIQAEGGRFVQQNLDRNWEEVTNDFARSKISKCFRNHRRTKKKIRIGTSLYLPV